MIKIIDRTSLLFLSSFSVLFITGMPLSFYFFVLKFNFSCDLQFGVADLDSSRNFQDLIIISCSLEGIFRFNL